MRHSAAHVMAEAILDLFPGTKLGIGPAIRDGFYYDFLLPRNLTPDDLAAIEARMAESIAADHPFERSELAAGRGARVPGRTGPAAQGRDHRRPGHEGRGGRRADAADVVLPPGPVHRPVPWPARRLHRAGSGRSSCCRSPGPTGAATRSARCSSASTARPGRTQEDLDQFLWRREQAKLRDHRRLGRAAGPVQLPRRQSRARRSGTPRAR